MTQRTTVLAAASLAFLGLCARIPAQTQKPLRVEVEPNALQVSDQGKLAPMTIEVRGVEPGHSVRIEVLRDVDGVPRRESPVDAWESLAADAQGVVRDKLDFEAKDWELPKNAGLWLRVSRSPDDPGAGLALFGLVENPCTLWPTLVDAFLGGECDPGLVQALRWHRGPAGLEDVTFEVRRLALTGPDGEEPETVQVPSTLGATGVAWDGDDALVVTRAPTSRDKGGADVVAGLYRIPLDGEPRLLWKPEDALMPAAPFVLGCGRIAFVRQALTGEPQEDQDAAVHLSIWDYGTVVDVLTLPYRIHQILASDAGGHRLLALTLGVRSNRPQLLVLRLGEKPSVEVVGYHHALYQAALRAPGGDVSAIAFEDNSGRWGWDVVLVDRSGEWVRDLVRRKKKDDLMPVWRPDGKEIAYLAEVSRFEGLP